MEDTCIFCRIMKGALPANIVYQDDDTVAFHDISPLAPVHVLIVPREHIASVNDIDEADVPLIGKLHLVAQKLARELGIADTGYRIVINTGDAAGQTVDHVHLHLLGGRPLRSAPV